MLHKQITSQVLESTVRVAGGGLCWGKEAQCRRAYVRPTASSTPSIGN